MNRERAGIFELNDGWRKATLPVTHKFHASMNISCPYKKCWISYQCNYWTAPMVICAYDNKNTSIKSSQLQATNRERLFPTLNLPNNYIVVLHSVNFVCKPESNPTKRGNFQSKVDYIGTFIVRPTHFKCLFLIEMNTVLVFVLKSRETCVQCYHDEKENPKHPWSRNI